ncbi:hypothetical protein ACF0H5_014489 [Mactra antiquata]
MADILNNKQHLNISDLNDQHNAKGNHSQRISDFINNYEDYNFYQYYSGYEQDDNYDGSYYGNHTSLQYDNYNDTSDLCQINYDVLLNTMPGYRLCNHILLPIFCTIGIVGSLLTVIVLSRKTMSTSTNSYLISLAFADLGFLLIVSPKFLETKLNRVAHYNYIATMTYASIFIEMFLMASVWLTVILAVERYIAICHPLRAMGICTVRRARIIIVLIFVVSVLLHIPKFFHHKLVYFEDHCVNQTVPLVQLTSLATNVTYRLVSSWINGFILVILPFALLLYLNICLIIEIHRSTNYLRYHLASDSNAQTIITSEEIKITMMLIAVVVNFFVFESPYVILIVVKQIKSQVFEHLYLYIAVTVLLLVVRSSLNFILYCWFSEKFWNTFKKTFCTVQCMLSRAPSWVRSRMSSIHSDHGHNNNRKISYFNTKDTTC